jgi:shikimate 5-dehydrogenase
MYFIGVSTSQSAIRRIFPQWCQIAGVEAELTGIDIPVGASRDLYIDALKRIAADPLASGALVTSHKVAVVEHARDFFSEFTADAELLGEVSCIVKREGELLGEALDLDCSGAALEEIVPAGQRRGRTFLILGAGGAGAALAAFLQRDTFCDVHATDINIRRLTKIRSFDVSTHVVPRATDNDEVLGRMPSGTVVVNATGRGKDLPGSPLTNNARFPPQSIAWDLNYRGNLRFLEQARTAGVRTADGWDYFVRGWSLTMSRVLGFELAEERMKAFREVAAAER